jgi:hypothetical protein
MTEQTQTNNFCAVAPTASPCIVPDDDASGSIDLATQSEAAVGPSMSVLRERVNMVALDVLLDNPHLLRDDVERSMLAHDRRELVDGVKTVTYATARDGGTLLVVGRCKASRSGCDTRYRTTSTVVAFITTLMCATVIPRCCCSCVSDTGSLAWRICVGT